MFTFQLLALSALSAAAIAAPAPAPQAGTGINDPNYLWQVSNWVAGCSSSGCSYAFDISGEGYQAQDYNILAFSASCSGDGEGSPLAQCSGTYDGIVVSAHLLAGDGTQANLEVTLSFAASEDSSYTITGESAASYNQYSSGPLVFNIEPSSATGVA